MARGWVVSRAVRNHGSHCAMAEVWFDGSGSGLVVVTLWWWVWCGGSVGSNVKRRMLYTTQTTGKIEGAKL